ncbi:PREDICTED: protein FAM163B [Tinamus guttatus]|uniref:protein FAM163B n=1 Tax=Tinamus guttatus TaxID=94827 RepID=UPI00052EFFD7|nr:PREDICTED: protein FAM163B [Tinamus guttatus]
MTAGTVVITGGILATVILLCIIAVLCYCRLQPASAPGLQALNPNRLSAMREAFSRSRSISTDV